MQIKFLNIKNFKSIRELEIRDVENCLILVGKNNTGKTVVLDAIRAVTGNYKVRETDFNERRQNIEITMTLQITEEDLRLFHNYGRVSNYKKYESWIRDFQKKLPCFQNGKLTFTCSINQNGTIRYDDGKSKNNDYILQVLPKVHFIDTARKLKSFQEDFFLLRQAEELSHLRSNICMFDSSRKCNQCFQ